MAIRYYIDLNCKPRTEIGESELLTLLTRWELAQSVRDQFKEKYNTTDEAKMRFRERVVDPNGEIEKRETSVADIRRECEALGKYSDHCDNCPANLDKTAYSCHQKIGFPLSARAEQWLVDQVAPTGSRGAELFIEACSQNDYGSAPLFANWRKAGFLEGKETVKGDRGGLLVSSDQVLNELFLVGDIMPNHALGIFVHLQALVSSDNRTGDDLIDLIENIDNSQSAEDAPTIDFNIKPEADDDESIREIKQFLFALFRAFSLQTPLAIRI